MGGMRTRDFFKLILTENSYVKPTSRDINKMKVKTSDSYLIITTHIDNR